MTGPARRALTERDLAAVDAMLAGDDEARGRRYPGDPLTRQPVHTVYLPADRVSAATTEEYGAAALAALAEHAPDAAALAAVTGYPSGVVADVWPLLRRKLTVEPVEDLRVDLEDGYGQRPDEVEDADALRAGRAIAAMTGRDGTPPYVGVRVKSLEGATRRRGIRSLDLVLGALLDEGELPPGWVFTLPKVTSVGQVEAMVEICGRLEQGYELPAGRLRFEVQVETAQAVLGPDGTVTLARFVDAAAGRCSGLHFGTYDYTAALGIAGGYQSSSHPAAVHATTTMQLAAADTGVRVSDGSSNVLPVGDRGTVHAAWALHARLVRLALDRGLYQGWDLHPAQLPTRFLATFVFFRHDRVAVGDRLRRYLTRTPGHVLDEPATARALAGFLLRGVRCGALTVAEAGDLTGTDVPALELLAARP